MGKSKGEEPSDEDMPHFAFDYKKASNLWEDRHCTAANEVDNF